MNSCFLNDGGFGDCSAKYSVYSGYFQLKNCNANTEIQLNNLKLINSMSSVRSQIVPESKLILLRSKKDCFYSELSNELSICCKHRRTQGCDWKPNDRCCDHSFEHSPKKKVFKHKVSFDMSLILIRYLFRTC